MADVVPFSVQPSSGTPIYRQITEQVEALIAGGALPPGSRLPSVRRVADSLAVNPMTISKAYSMLETAGLVERLRGKGMQVCGTAEPIDTRREALRELATELARRGRQLGLNQTQVLSVVREAYRATDGSIPRDEPKAVADSS